MTTDVMDRISVILVEPKSAGNVGAAARALHNMGLSRLTLVGGVSTQEPEARMMAVGAFGVVGLVAAPIVWAGGSRVWRAMAPWGMKRGRKAMERLLQALAGHVQTGGAFSGGALGFPEIPPSKSLPDSSPGKPGADPSSG